MRFRTRSIDQNGEVVETIVHESQRVDNNYLFEILKDVRKDSLSKLTEVKSFVEKGLYKYKPEELQGLIFQVSDELEDLDLALNLAVTLGDIVSKLESGIERNGIKKYSPSNYKSFFLSGFFYRSLRSKSVFDRLCSELHRVDPKTLSEQILSVKEEYEESYSISVFKGGSRIVPDMTYDEFVKITHRYKNTATTSSRTNHFNNLFELLSKGNTTGFEATSS